MTTSRRSRQNPLVREFILRNVTDHPGDIGRLAAQEFDLSRNAINGYVRRLIDEDLITATGKTSARQYELKEIVNVLFVLDDITRLSDEDIIWRFWLSFAFSNLVMISVSSLCLLWRS